MKEFRPKEANPEGYQDKMSFWVRNISRWSCQGNIILTPASVRIAFVREGIPPDDSCIKHVLHHMMHEGRLVRKTLFLQNLKERQEVASSWTTWGLSLVRKPVSWGVSFLTSSSSSTESPDGHEGSWMSDQEEFVDVEGIKTLSHLIFKQLSATGKQVFTWMEVKSLTPSLSSDVVQLVFLVLSAEGRAVILEDCGLKLVKISSSNASFTQTEVGLCRLESARELIERDIRQIGAQIHSLKQEARNAVKDKNVSVAKQLLKRKKRLEDLLTMKESQLDNIDVLMRQLSDSDSQEAILRTYKEAADVLKSVQKSPGLREADKTLSDLEDVILCYNELNLDMSRVIDATSDSDAIALEDELTDILKEEVHREGVFPASRRKYPTERETLDDEASGERNSTNSSNHEEDFNQLLGRLEKLRQPTHSLDQDQNEGVKKQPPSGSSRSILSHPRNTLPEAP